MANKMTKWIDCNAAAVTSLSIQPCGSRGERRENALQACERFLRAAALLPKQAFLGWQIQAGENGRHQAAAFGSAGAKAAPEDFTWIFSQCAATEDAPLELPGDLREGCRRVYALQAVEHASKAICVPDSAAYNDDFQDEVVPANHFLNLWEELGKSKAILRMLARSGPDTACGVILISLPDEITLRMQTMVSLAFPELVAIPVNAPEDACTGIDRLPSKHLMNVMVRLLDALMAEQPSRDPTENGLPEPDTNDQTAPSFAPAAEQDSPADCTPVEELDLSVRAFNCLKRAGINTVGQLRTMTDDDFAHVRNLGRKSTQEIKEKLAKMAIPSASVPLTAPNYREMLENLIGLEPVKTQVKKIAAFAKMKHALAAQSSTPVPMALNMEFTGNPGTAKTTVARILAGIFHEMGLLPGSQLVEVGRADLVARYEGQTADQVKSVFRRAKGKILFIDEAYSLVENCEGEFGDEAINTIVQEMENHRGDTIVIFAGYPDKMKAFFARNPGLRSRVPFQIHFDDYSVGQMVQIAELEAQKRGFSIRPEAKARVADICRTAANRADSGNGRFCRNLVENAILEYAVRVYGDLCGDLCEDHGEAPAQEFMLEKEDFTLPEDLQEAKRPLPMGFAR